MEFPQPLARGRLVSRYKRFFADVVLDEGGPVTAHIANPGRMLGLVAPGAVCWLSPATTPGRRLAWSVELIEAEGGALVGVNTALANTLAAEAVVAGVIAALAGHRTVRREVRYGANSRIDLLLEADAGSRGRATLEPSSPFSGPAERCWVEVKSVTLSRKAGLAEWPDCVSTHSSRQLEALSALVDGGERSALLFVVQRADCNRFAVAADLDPTFASALRGARKRGVEVFCCASSVNSTGLRITHELPMDLTWL